MTMTIAFNAIQNIILIFPDERPVFLREVNNNMYSVTAYFFAKIIAELPASILTPVIFGSISYYAIGLSTVHAYKFPLFCKLLNRFTLPFSIHLSSTLQCCWIICSDYFYTFC